MYTGWGQERFQRYLNDQNIPMTFFILLIRYFGAVYFYCFAAKILQISKQKRSSDLANLKLL